MPEGVKNITEGSDATGVVESFSLSSSEKPKSLGGCTPFTTHSVNMLVSTIVVVPNVTLNLHYHICLKFSARARPTTSFRVQQALRTLDWGKP